MELSVLMMLRNARVHYGTASEVGSERASSPRDLAYEAIDLNVDDEVDLASWNAEHVPLLQRTVEQAKSLGVKRTLSQVGGASFHEVKREDLSVPWKLSRKAKVFALTLVCIIVTILLLFLPEQISNDNLISVQKSDSYVIDIDELYSTGKKTPSDNILEVWLHGSFIPEELTPLARNWLRISTVRDGVIGDNATIDKWMVGLLPYEMWDMFYMEKRTLSHAFQLEAVDLSQENVSLVFETTSEISVALSVQIQLLSVRVDSGILYGSIVLVAMYVCIILEVAHRTVIAMLTATTAIGVLATLNERPSLEDIITWLDIETLTLLFSMMVIVSVLSETGAFNYLGFWAFKATKGKVWPLLTTLCVITAVVSAFLDNVTTILLMTPVVIQLCEAINIDPVRVLIATVIFSNIGGAATAIGDPPNVLIASDPGILEGGVTFLTFTMHVGLGVIFVAFACYGLLRLMYRKLGEHKEDRDLHDLRHELIIWHRTLHGLSNFSREEAMVKEIIGLKIEELRGELDEKVAVKRRGFNVQPLGQDDRATLDAMEESCRITNPGLLIKSCSVLAVTVTLFFLQNIPSLNLSLGWTALLGAIALLILADKAEVESVFSRVEWTTLIFFATLFVVMEALAKLGLLNAIGQAVEGLVMDVPEDYRLSVAILLILWVSGIASAFIDNIPFTTMMLPVVKGLAENTQLDLPLQPLVWSLALGACLGGNGTLIGASANVVCAGVAEQHGYKFTFMDFFVVGFPMTILSLLVASAYLMICHVALDWNG